MAGASTLDPDNLAEPDGNGRAKGHDTGSLGPSDSTDSGSDVAGGHAMSPDELAGDSDAEGTGERPGAGRDDGPPADLGIDAIVGADEAGLGSGPDEAEAARRGD